MSGRLMKYPYTWSGKFLTFPYKHHWQNSRSIKFWALSALICTPLFLKIHSFVNSDENVRIWAAKREARKHDPFAPAHDNGH